LAIIISPGSPTAGGPAGGVFEKLDVFHNMVYIGSVKKNLENCDAPK
jgi:hypothetical protein